MEALFLKLVNMSITASYLVLAAVGVRLVFRKTPKWVLCLLWGLVALRLVCPVTLESALSLIPSAEPLPQEIIYTAAPRIQSGVEAVDQAVNPALEQSLTPAPGASANPTQIWSFVLSRLWAVGVAGMVLYALFSYLMLRRRMATAFLVQPGIKCSERVNSPFVLGLLRPMIYLPAHMEPGDRDYVIAHEKAHIRRRDHWWKPLGFLLLSVYWFNPVLWLAYILLCRDIEAACDEKVIRDLSREERQAYSRALLHCSIRRKSIAACPLAFGEVGVKERIKQVMSYKKPGFWMVLLALIVSGAVAVTFLTDPEGMPLTGIQDGRNYGDLLDNVTEMTLVQDGESRLVEDLDGALAAMREIQVKTREVSRSRDETRDASNQIVLNGHFYVNFGGDYSRVWIDNRVKPTYTYAVLQPARVAALFDQFGTVSPVEETVETAPQSAETAQVQLVYQKRSVNLPTEDARRVLELVENALGTESQGEAALPEDIREYTDNPGMQAGIQIWYADGTGDFYETTPDFGVLWEYDQEPTHFYTLEQGSWLTEMAQTMTEGIRNLPTSGEPFADKNSPWDWTSQVTENAISSAEANVVWEYTATAGGSSQSMTFGALNQELLEQLLDILHEIPQSAFSPSDEDVGSWSGTDLRRTLTEPGSTLALFDGVNNLCAVIRSTSQGLRFALCDDLARIDNPMEPLLETVTYWNLEDSALSSYMQALMGDATLITYAIGGEYRWQDPIYFEEGALSLVLELPDDWTYEVESYTPQAESYGVRCRPEAVSEGWIYFSFWPEGYHPQETNRYIHTGRWNDLPLEISYPHTVHGSGYLDTRGAVWSYRMAHAEQGDYAVINQNADSWFPTYEDQISDILTYTQAELIDPQTP